MNKKIFFDLDGTLLDSRKRMHTLFQHLVPDSQLSYDEYWNYKKNKTGHPEILKNNFAYNDAEIDQFKKIWLDLIEAPEWLNYDKPFDGVTDYLARLKEKNDIYLVTARQFEASLFLQMKQHNWDKIFKEIFVTGGNKEKADLIMQNVKTGPDDWFIGDTGKDIQTGKLLGMKTAAVLSGFLSRKKLQEYNPDVIAEKVTDLLF